MEGGVKFYAICDDPTVFFCLVDEAFLCGDCDEQIHGANLLAHKYHHMEIAPMGILSGLGGQMSATSEIVTILVPDSQSTTMGGLNVGIGEVR
jgi:hypothetical protein